VQRCKEKTINTVNKKIIRFNHFLAHSKLKNNIIETIDYSSALPKCTYYKLNNNFDILKQINIKTEYISMIHDFVSTEQYIIIIDSPVRFKLENITLNKFPIELDKNSTTKLLIIDKYDGNTIKIDTNESFYILHYGDQEINKDEIIIYGCFYDYFNYNDVNNNHGKYRKIIINIKNKNFKIIKNKELETYSVDFPIIYNNMTLLLINNNLINIGFIIVKNFKIYKKILLNKSIYGDPVIIDINNNPHIICFTKSFNTNLNYITIYDIINNNEISILIEIDMFIGFHSLFIDSF
jgi:hypothetical protein